MQNKWLGILLVLVFALGIYAALVIAPPSVKNSGPLESRTQHLSWFPQARALSDFSLSNEEGKNFTVANLQGKWTLAFVGYTFCPDICPVTLAEINSIYPQLSAIETDTPLQVWFLSVDPKRDTIERLNEYINYFHPDFIATTGTHVNLFPLVRSMGMMYSFSESTDDPNYLVDHSASIVVINPNGNVVGRFKPEYVPGKPAISNMQHVLDDVSILLGG